MERRRKGGGGGKTGEREREAGTKGGRRGPSKLASEREHTSQHTEFVLSESYIYSYYYLSFLLSPTKNLSPLLFPDIVLYP